MEIYNHILYKDILNVITNGQCAQLITSFNQEGGICAQSLKRELLLESMVVHSEVSGKEVDDHYMEPFIPEPRLIILGGGHIAIPLVQMAAMLGFYIIVADDRPSFASISRFPQANEVICDDFKRVFNKIQPGINDYIIIVTRGHRHDGDCLREIFKFTEGVYTGMIGSKRRVKDLKELLKEEGLDQQRLERICTPIGLSIGAVTPEEISISILAQVIEYRRSPIKNKCFISDAEQCYDVWERLGELSLNEVFCVATIIATKGSVPRKKGAKMIIFQDGRLFGSIGGGCSEGEVITKARRLMGSGQYQIIHVDMTAEVAESEGMVCGGTMEVLLESC